MKKMLLSLIAVVVMIAFVPVGVYASSNTVKSKMYEIYSTGTYVYTTGNKGIYRVKLKNGKPVSKIKIAKCGSNYSLGHLKFKGKYVYYKKFSNSTDKEYLYRVKKTGGTVKKLATMGEFSEVAFTKYRIYYSYPGETDENGMVIETIKKVMKLNGTSKKNTKIEAHEIDKYNNKKGYVFKTKVSGGKVLLYFKTPKGKILLEKI